jgi:membrane-associated phospholipid phosphatase
MLSAAALGPYRKLRLALTGLCAAVCVSTVTTGWHYLIDLVGGLAVTLAAQPAARVLLLYVVTPGRALDAGRMMKRRRSGAGFLLPIW